MSSHPVPAFPAPNAGCNQVRGTQGFGHGAVNGEACEQRLRLDRA